MITWLVVSAVALVGVGLGYGLGAFDSLSGPISPPALAQGAAIPVTDDTYTTTADPEANAGTEPELKAGGANSAVAVTYVRFEASKTVDSAKLRLPIAKIAADEVVEVSQVDSQWNETNLVASNAPSFGAVLDSQSVKTSDTYVEFTVSAIKQGAVAFAVTTPSSANQISFNSRQSQIDAPSLQLGSSGGQTPATESQSLLDGKCQVQQKLVPSCGSLQGVAPGAHSGDSKPDALRGFESRTGHGQHIYHSYHRGNGELFPTKDEIALTNEKQPRVLFINWKPQGASWAAIANGDPDTDAYLDKLASHLKTNFDKPFFFTVHHEPEDDVDPSKDSGYTAADYAAMFRHVIERLRANGVDKMVSVMVYMAYLKWTKQPWHSQLYPGDDVVDWVGWDTYGYSEPGYGYGDFAELVNRVDAADPGWPGFYRWAANSFPDKPLMVAEWGVWYSEDNRRHQGDVFASAAAQLALFPRIKALVYFESENAEGRNSSVDADPHGLDAYRRLAGSRHFSVGLGLSQLPRSSYFLILFRGEQFAS